MFIHFTTGRVVLESGTLYSSPSFCVNFGFNWTSISVAKQDLLAVCGMRVERVNLVEIRILYVRDTEQVRGGAATL